MEENKRKDAGLVGGGGGDGGRSVIYHRHFILKTIHEIAIN